MGNCMFLRKGETHTKPLTGILASDLAVGSTVKLMVDGVATDFLVVNQGIPGSSSLYDSSCDGTWLLGKSIEDHQCWDSSDSDKYASSNIHVYLNGTFFSKFDTIAQESIKQVKIPYSNGSTTVYSGSNGLSAKVFLLSCYEVGYTTSYHSNILITGAKLDYFTSGDGTDAKNIRKLVLGDGVVNYWWLRSAYKGSSVAVWSVTGTGGLDSAGSANTTYNARPALILPSTALFDKNTLILKGVA